MFRVNIHMLPTLIDRDLSGSTAVVIDILRASTTIIHALAQGAQSVIPCLSVEDAFTAARQFPRSECLLGGERHGQLIEGFDLDNSPLRYTPAVVRGKTIIFTTTNGTRALLACRQASQVFVGAFVNRSALVAALRRAAKDVHLVCAGTDGQLTAEDILFAGAVAADLLERAEDAWRIGSVQSQMALDFYYARSRDPQTFRDTVFDSLGARNLRELGMTADIDRALQADLFRCAPVWTARTGRIEVSG